jgi:solute carrier family 35 protein C2
MRVYVLILYLYMCSLSLTTLNKTMFDVLNIKIPLIATCVNFSLVALVLRGLYRFNGRSPPFISSADYRQFIIPIALFTALDVGLSNLSYSIVSVSVMTVIKSTNVVLTYILSMAFGLESFNVRVFAACLVVLTGVWTATDSMEIKHVRGVFYLLGAVVSLSFRWVLVHRMTKHFAALDLVYLTQPVSALFIFPVSVWLESGALDSAAPTGRVVFNSIRLLGLLLVGSGLGLFLVYFEYLLVGRTSSLTLCISGIGKEILALLLSGVVFSEHLSVRQWLAVGVSLVGIFAFSRFHKPQRSRSPPEYRAVPTLSHDDLVPFE